MCACDGALDDKTLELTPLDVASGGLVNRRVDESWRFSRDDADIEPKDAGETRVTFTTHYVYSWGSGGEFYPGYWKHGDVSRVRSRGNVGES